MFSLKERRLRQKLAHEHYALATEPSAQHLFAHCGFIFFHDALIRLYHTYRIERRDLVLYPVGGFYRRHPPVCGAHRQDLHHGESSIIYLRLERLLYRPLRPQDLLGRVDGCPLQIFCTRHNSHHLEDLEGIAVSPQVSPLNRSEEHTS